MSAAELGEWVPAQASRLYAGVIDGRNVEGRQGRQA